MKGKDVTSSPLLSPKVRVKPLKRRRIRLGNNDNELDESTMEILNAIRDIPSCCERNSSNRKPLPAIGSQTKSGKNEFLIESLSNASRAKKNPNISNDVISNDVQLIDDALTQNKNLDDGEDDDDTKRSLRPRRRRERTFISSKKSELLKEDNDDNVVINRINFDQKQESKMDFNNNSMFSDFSEDLTNNKSERRRAKLLNAKIENLEDDELTNKRPSVKAGRRSTKPSSQIQQISFLKESNFNPDSSRSSKTIGRLDDDDDDFLLRLDQNSPVEFEINSLSSETSKKEVLAPKRRSRRHCCNTEEDPMPTGRDNGFSDEASLFSDDFSDVYDPSFNTKPHKTRNSQALSSFRLKTEDKDPNGGIFTSPQRHKKRSRHQQSKLKQNPEDNLLFSNDSDLLSTNSFSLPGENEEAPYLERKLYPKHQRRRAHKFLPPLSENLSSSK